ncbi:LacI family DNA-binding transcriptional regulator [Croceicoccus sp. BE223]|uniref:LacI family DNA-binding transcriptional regulator n=1 Tax=Croceicoccus sp. BE223 TaxID=2817716 RepID=UPI00285E7478|nr:LacI family DNA-binding transcriptional regulator [Croceicoccus sp. BE223]MDR7103311.1 DNA-binding LacI/PurR family transcriptional regulator [Croceicoccus sp. BE223]
MGRKPSGRPTSFDIAYAAGVSQPTVSRALRGDQSVSRETRERIEKIARDLNYTVDKNASSLRSQRSNTIALLFFEDPTPDDSMINPFFLAMLGSITRACANRGLDLLISFQRMEDDWHVRYQDAHRADGLILLGYGDFEIYRSRLEKLVEQGTHFARWGSVRDDFSGSTIGSDNLGAGRMAGEHLLSIGRRRIAFLGHSTGQYPEFAHRYDGMVAACREAGFEPDPGLQFDALTNEDAGYRAARELLASGRAFDAIFAASDLIAIGAMRALAGAGLRVPEDVAVVGFDNIPAASLTSPPLTTVQQDVAGAGKRLVETLMAQIERRPAPDARLPTRLLVRGSTVAT